MNFPTKHTLKKVLVIDDDEEYNFLTQDTFEFVGLTSELIFKLNAIEGLEYLSQITSDAPDLILLDINMPMMNGWEFLDEYQKLNYHKKLDTVIAMISSSIYQEDKDKALTYDKVIRYFEKPLSEDHLSDLVTSCFAYNKAG